jgi:ABC-type uncharacterized transport system permease subunit
MHPLGDILFHLGVVAYSAAATLYLVELARRESSAFAVSFAPRLLLVALLLHGAAIASASLASGVCPVTTTHFALSLSAWCAVLVYLVLRRKRRLDAIGAFVAPVALVLMITSSFIDLPVRHREHAHILLAAHVTANMLGFGLFLLAGATGLFYIAQERQLKAKRARGLFARLPALDTLDVAGHRLLFVGFLLLTFGVVSGAVFAGEPAAPGAAAIVRAGLAYLAWLLMAGVLLLRKVAGWRGRRAAYGALAGVVCVLAVVVLYAVQAEGI